MFNDMGKSWKTYRKLHRWPGLIISFILLYYSLTGIIMNHREWFAGVDFNRKIMPGNYMYRNWNNAAVRGNLIISSDSILIYGNIGIWSTDSAFKDYISVNTGFPGGSDNRRIYDLHRTPDGSLYAATLFGLYGYDSENRMWQKFATEGREQRFIAIESIGDTVYAFNRSDLFIGISSGIKTSFIKKTLPPPTGFDNKITLFQTIWQIHSGEILGLPGKVYVDVLGIITIFLAITGITWFFFPGWIKRRVRQARESLHLRKTAKWSLRWHNKIGAWTFVLLILLYLTGMFLRPPLLIAIGESRVKPVRYSHLDQPNPWYDKLRDILFDPGKRIFLLAASDGIYHINPHDLVPVKYRIQPPVSVMGINVFKNLGTGTYLVGSFTGMFIWNPESPEIFDFMTGEPYRQSPMGKPVGDYTITGLIEDTEKKLYPVDYEKGVISMKDEPSFPGMPENIIRESKISMWNLCLEIHTGRIYENIVGGFYILVVPLVGLTGITVVFSGYIVWRRKYRKQGYNNIV